MLFIYLLVLVIHSSSVAPAPCHSHHSHHFVLASEIGITKTWLCLFRLRGRLHRPDLSHEPRSSDSLGMASLIMANDQNLILQAIILIVTVGFDSRLLHKLLTSVIKSYPHVVAFLLIIYFMIKLSQSHIQEHHDCNPTMTATSRHWSANPFALPESTLPQPHKSSRPRRKPKTRA